METTEEKIIKPHTWTNEHGKVRILRRVDRDGISGKDHHKPFDWNRLNVGDEVVCPDWMPHTDCGNGLHGWPWGIGLGEGCNYDILRDIWLVIEADPADVVGELKGGQKCKCQKGAILFKGDFAGAWALIHDGRHAVICAMSKDGATNSASGDGAASSASGQLTASSASGPEAASSASGDGAASSASGPEAASSASGQWAASSASGAGAASSASGYGAASSASGLGVRVCAVGGRNFAMAAGVDGCAMAGPGGVIVLGYIREDGTLDAMVGRVGEGGIEADTPYRVEGGKFVRADQ